MVKTVFIGESFLSSGDLSQLYYFFYGANRITATLWQVNFRCSIPFCLNLEAGNTLRIPKSLIFIQKDGSVGLRSDYVDNWKGHCEVASIKIVDIGQDFLTVEYELAK
ncbi:MAG: hypothetical protein ABFC31_12405 [Clostridiaceae bacterium]